MSNPFATDNMAAGYARSRPPIHPRIIERAYPHLPPTSGIRRALDIGCGAGLSTKALAPVATHCVGIEPAAAMLTYARSLVPDASFVVGAAEAMPLASRSVNFIAAAGSLNYTDLNRFFPEAARVLTPGGPILVYDFSPGRTFRDDDSLDEWFSTFVRRYPPPESEARPLSPEILESVDSGFRVRAHQHFDVAISLTFDFYTEYIMTETSVAFARRRGVPDADIRGWCIETLQPLWGSRTREVFFRCYFACMLLT